MRTMVSVVVLVALTGCEPTTVRLDGSDGAFARGDTADSGLLLQPQCADPGVCGCDFTGYDLDASGSDETCIHDGANVDGAMFFFARAKSNSTARKFLKN